MKLVLLLISLIALTGCLPVSSNYISPSATEITFVNELVPSDTPRQTSTTAPTVTQTPTLTPEPTYTPTPTQFYYGSESLMILQDLSLLEVRPDGTIIKELIPKYKLMDTLGLEKVYYHYAHLSHDAEKLFLAACTNLTKNQDCDWEYYVVDTDLTGITRIETPEHSSIGDVAWSPDDKYMLVQVYFEEKNKPDSVERSAYYLYEAEDVDGNINLIVNTRLGEYPQAVWEPDSNYVYVINAGNFYSVAIDGQYRRNLNCPFCKELRKYITGASYAGLTPDGKTIIVEIGRIIIYLVDLETFESRSFRLERIGAGQISISPAGDKILLSSMGGRIIGGRAIDTLDGFGIVDVISGKEILFIRKEELVKKATNGFTLCNWFPDNVHFFVKAYIDGISQLYVGNVVTGDFFRFLDSDSEYEECPLWLTSDM